MPTSRPGWNGWSDWWTGRRQPGENPDPERVTGTRTAVSLCADNGPTELPGNDPDLKVRATERILLGTGGPLIMKDVDS